jgi:HK97 family phage major capsid protein
MITNDAMGGLNDTLDKISGAFDDFKRRHDERLEKLETRIARPGAFTGGPSAPAERGSGLVDVETGRPLLALKAGDDFAQKYRAHGLIGTDEFGELRLGDFLRAVAGQKSTDLARKALAVGTDSAGGHAVPNVLMPTILEALVPNSSLLQAGTKIATMEGLAAGGKTYTFAATSAIPTASWRNEAGNVAESDPTFRAIVATPRSLAFHFKVSRELLADASNLDGALTTAIGQAMAKALDHAGLLGTGTAPEPRGLANTVGINAVGNGTNGAALGSVLHNNLFAAIAAILAADGPMPTAAIMAPRTMVGFANLRDTTNQPLATPEMLRAVRFIPTSQLPVNQTVGSSTDCSSIFVGDFSRASWIMRETLSIQRLNEVFATTGQIGFVAHVRADFIVEYPTAFAAITGVRP